jgi:endoglucanase
MAGVLASIDSAATSVGFPTRNMHTISESGNTSDVLAAIHVLSNTLLAMDKESDLRKNFRETHPRLDITSEITHQGFDKIKEADS